MNTPRVDFNLLQLQKSLVAYCVERLNIHSSVCTQRSIPCFFEDSTGFLSNQETRVLAKVKEIEDTSDSIVYALTHETWDFGETWSMLCVPRINYGPEDVLAPFKPNEFYAYTYVWNETNEQFSGFGDVLFHVVEGSLKRVS